MDPKLTMEYAPRTRRPVEFGRPVIIATGVSLLVSFFVNLWPTVYLAGGEVWSEKGTFWQSIASLPFVWQLSHGSFSRALGLWLQDVSFSFTLVTLSGAALAAGVVSLTRGLSVTTRPDQSPPQTRDA